MNDLVNRAERFARLRHAGQIRKGKAKEPYTINLGEAATLVKKWGEGVNAITSAWLHDTVEDCPPISSADLASLLDKMEMTLSVHYNVTTTVVLKSKVASTSL